MNNHSPEFDLAKRLDEAIKSGDIIIITNGKSIKLTQENLASLNQMIKVWEGFSGAGIILRLAKGLLFWFGVIWLGASVISGKISLTQFFGITK